MLHGLLLALAAAVLLHVGIIVVVNLLGHALHLDAVEKASMIYSNAGNLIIPIVTAVLGKEWVIYSSAFLSVQLFLLWSHAKSMLCGEKSFELKKVLTNINMIAILAGAALFLLHIQLPAVIEDSLDMVGSAIGPISMIILGMLMAGMNFKKILGYRRLWLVTALRLVGIPLAAVALLKLSGLAHLVPDGQTILLVSLLATCTPSASTITQMAQIYGKDADYASAINVVTTLLCIFTITINERTKEFGILASLGADSGKLSGIVLTEGALIGLIGGLLGAAIGTVAMLIFKDTIMTVLKVPALNTNLFYLLTLGLKCMLLALAVSIAASLYSAWKVSRNDLDGLIRGEEM